MANIALVLKEEITRLSRKETRSETDRLRKASVQYRSEIAALKRRTAALEQKISQLERLLPQKDQEKEEPEAKSNARFTAKGFKTLRNRLGLTAETAGTLLGVSAQTIYNWETGNSSPRDQQMVRIVTLRGMGKREIGAILQNLGG